MNFTSPVTSRLSTQDAPLVVDDEYVDLSSMHTKSDRSTPDPKTVLQLLSHTPLDQGHDLLSLIPGAREAKGNTQDQDQDQNQDQRKNAKVAKPQAPTESDPPAKWQAYVKYLRRVKNHEEVKATELDMSVKRYEEKLDLLQKQRRKGPRAPDGLIKRLLRTVSHIGSNYKAKLQGIIQNAAPAKNNSTA